MKKLQKNEKPEDKFEKLDNCLIEYAAENNHILLAAYVYSKMMCNQDHRIGTTLELVTDMFFPTYDKRSRKVERFKNAFELLETGITYTVKNEKIETIYISFDDSIDIQKASYKQPLWFSMVEGTLDNRFTMLKYRELDYLLGCVKENSIAGSTQLKINSVDLLSMFLLIKLFYNRNANFNKGQTDMTNPTFFSTDTLVKKLHMSGKTVLKYVKYLVSIGMLKVKTGNFKDRKASEYSIDDAWSKKAVCTEKHSIVEDSAEYPNSESCLEPIKDYEKYRKLFNRFSEKVERITKTLELDNSEIPCIDEHHADIEWCAKFIKSALVRDIAPEDRAAINKAQPSIVMLRQKLMENENQSA